MYFRPFLQTSRRIVFHHLPKTGGTSFGELVTSTMRPAEVCPAFNDVSLLSVLHEPFGYYQGHFSWFVAQLIGDNSDFLTMIREPIARCISQYSNFADRSRIQGRWGVSEDGRQLNSILSTCHFSFAEMMASDHSVISGAFSNVMVRSFLPFLLRPDELRPAFYDAGLVRLALDNFHSKIKWFGVQEEIGLSLVHLASSFRLLPELFIQKKNVSTFRYLASPNEIALCRSLNLMDAEFYDSLVKEKRELNIEQLKQRSVANFVEDCNACFSKRGCDAGERRFVDFFPEEKFFSQGWSELEVTEHGIHFRWSGDTDAIISFASATLPKEVWISSLLSEDDARLTSLKLNVNGLAYGPFFARAGTIAFQPSTKVDECKCDDQVRLLSCRISGMSVEQETEFGVRAFLIAVSRVRLVF